jgi:hypothetical protein
MQLYDCWGGTPQRWTYNAGKQFTIAGKCLDVSGQSTANGSAVIISDCVSRASQQWNINSSGTISGVQSGRCLDANGAGTANGTKIIIWDCHGRPNQQWTFRN